MSAEPIPSQYHQELTSKREDLTRLWACWREFMSHLSPRAVLAALVVVLIARVYVGQWSWRDLLPPLALLAAQPFVEWAIHKYLLHLPPVLNIILIDIANLDIPDQMYLNYELTKFLNQQRHVFQQRDDAAIILPLMSLEHQQRKELMLGELLWTM